MAKRPYRRHSEAKSAEGREIASRILLARRQGKTTKEIQIAFGIKNERTVRKIVAGETSGTKIYREQTRRVGASPNLFRADVVIGEDAEGFEEVRTVNVKIASVRNSKGQLVAPTPFDIFRYPNLHEVARQEAEAMLRRYGDTIYRPTTPHVRGLRRVGRMRVEPHEIRGTVTR